MKSCCDKDNILRLHKRKGHYFVLLLFLLLSRCVLPQKKEILDFLTVCGNIFKANFYFGRILGWDQICAGTFQNRMSSKIQFIKKHRNFQMLPQFYESLIGKLGVQCKYLTNFPKTFPEFPKSPKTSKIMQEICSIFQEVLYLGQIHLKKLSDFLRLEMDVRDLQISDSQLYFKLLKIVGLLHPFPTLENRKCNVNHIRLY